MRGDQVGQKEAAARVLALEVGRIHLRPRGQLVVDRPEEMVEVAGVVHRAQESGWATLLMTGDVSLDGSNVVGAQDVRNAVGSRLTQHDDDAHFTRVIGDLGVVTLVTVRVVSGHLEAGHAQRVFE